MLHEAEKASPVKALTRNGMVARCCAGVARGAADRHGRIVGPPKNL